MYSLIEKKQAENPTKKENFSINEAQDATAKSNKAGFRMDRETDRIRNFELATRSGNGRKSANPGLSRDAERQFETFGSRVAQLTKALFPEKVGTLNCAYNRKRGSEKNHSA